MIHRFIKGFFQGFKGECNKQKSIEEIIEVIDNSDINEQKLIIVPTTQMSKKQLLLEFVDEEKEEINYDELIEEYRKRKYDTSPLKLIKYIGNVESSIYFTREIVDSKYLMVSQLVNEVTIRYGKCDKKYYDVKKTLITIQDTINWLVNNHNYKITEKHDEIFFLVKK